VKRGPGFYAGAMAVSLCVAGLAGSARASVLGLENTTDASAWSWTSVSPVGFSGTAVPTFNPAYVPATGWISTDTRGGTSYSDVVFSQTFNAPTAGTYSFSGVWGVDNTATISVDGKSVGASLGPFGYSTFDQSHNFSFDVTLVAGTNTITFDVNNTRPPADGGNGVSPDGPLALNVQFNNVSAVPEPATWGMMILGFASIGFLAYRRRKNGGLAFRVA
jgi:hypothetical protein